MIYARPAWRKWKILRPKLDEFTSAKTWQCRRKKRTNRRQKKRTEFLFIKFSILNDWNLELNSLYCVANKYDSRVYLTIVCTLLRVNSLDCPHDKTWSSLAKTRRSVHELGDLHCLLYVGGRSHSQCKYNYHRRLPLLWAPATCIESCVNDQNTISCNKAGVAWMNLAFRKATKKGGFIFA